MNTFQVGQPLPGYCCGLFAEDTKGHTMRVEAVGYDWVVVRDHKTRVWLCTDVESLHILSEQQRQLDEAPDVYDP